MAHAAKDSDNFAEKSNMKYGSGQLNVSEVSWTGGHVTCTCLTSLATFNDTLSGVH